MEDKKYVVYLLTIFLLPIFMFCNTLLGQDKKPSSLLFLPNKKLFKRKLADPKEIQLSSRLITNRNEFGGNIGFSIPFLEFKSGEWPLQLRVEGNAFLVSKLETPDFPVQSTDYTIAFPLDFRKRNFSARFRWGHISSHLGDDFNQIDNIDTAVETLPDSQQVFVRPKKFSREFFEMYGSYDINDFRIYSGFIWAYHIVNNTNDNGDLNEITLQIGLEWVDFKPERFVNPYAAVDFQPKEGFNWQPDYNIQVGMMLGKNRWRRMRIAAEVFHGHSPQGQFFQRMERDFNLMLAFDL